jgi:hypothetical protein
MGGVVANQLRSAQAAKKTQVQRFQDVRKTLDDPNFWSVE